MADGSSSVRISSFHQKRLKQILGPSGTFRNVFGIPGIPAQGFSGALKPPFTLKTNLINRFYLGILGYQGTPGTPSIVPPATTWDSWYLWAFFGTAKITFGSLCPKLLIDFTGNLTGISCVLLNICIWQLLL